MFPGHQLTTVSPIMKIMHKGCSKTFSRAAVINKGHIPTSVRYMKDTSQCAR